MARVVVIGGGVAGLTAALFLGRAGHDIVVLERDAGDVPPSPDEAFARWSRRGAPQARHSHAFLALLRNTLRDRAPDVLTALADAGATDLPMTDRPPPEMEGFEPEPGDADLVAIACRRITFEWVLRRLVDAEPSVRFESGCAVTGLTGTVSAGAARISGVWAGNRALDADLVVDAAGRRSSLPVWLAAMGGPVPADEHVDCGIVYYSRFYRLRDGVDPPPLEGPIGSDLGYLKYALFVGDNRTFSVTFGVSPADDELRPALLRAASFDRAAGALPATAAWVDPDRSLPITEVAVMAALKNRRRHLGGEGDPAVLGVCPVGDAAVHTNPLYGRGCSLAVAHAAELADLVSAHGTDHQVLAPAFAARTRALLDPWYRASVVQDEQGRHAWDLGEGVPDDGNPMRSFLRDGVFPAARRDPVVWRAFIRGFNLLDAPEHLMQNTDVAGRIWKAWEERDQRPPPAPDGPTRAEMLTAIGLA